MNALQSRSESLKKLEDSNHRTFLKRLVHYFKPSSNCFSRVELGNKKQTQMYTLAGLELIDCLLEVEEVSYDFYLQNMNVMLKMFLTSCRLMYP